MSRDRDREGSYGGFQYRWNYDEYQKTLQRKRKKSAARGMRAFCMTTVFVFLLCTASLLVVLTASFLRSAANTLPAPTIADGVPHTRPLEPGEQTPDTDAILSIDTAPPPASPTEPKEPNAPADPLGTPANDAADVQDSAYPPETEPLMIQGVVRDEYAPEDGKDLFSAMTISEIAETCSASAVTVQCRNKEYSSFGSGFFLSDDGYLVTNHHVVRRYTDFTVMLSDGTVFPAELISVHPEQDLALLKIEGAALPVVKIGSSATAAIGDQVVAIGTPGSVDFAGTVTYGYISGLDRSVEITDIDDKVIGHMDMIQITAVINPGNSGGPLFNCFGEIIAINTMKITGDGFEGMGFAIPIDDVYETLYAAMTAHREANAPETEPETEDTPPDQMTTSDTEVPVPDERPYAPLGVRCETVTEKESELYKIPVGVIIRHIEPASYAETSDLRTGDIILRINGEDMPNVAALDAWAQNARVGDTAVFDIYRAGEALSVTVSFGTLETDEPLPTEIEAEAAEETLPTAA